MQEQQIKIIVVAKQRKFIQRIENIFSNEDWSIQSETRLDKVVQKLDANHYDVLVLASSAYQETQVDVIEVLKDINAKSPLTRILLFVDPEDIQLAMSALKAGTYQYTRLPVSDHELRLLVETAVERKTRRDFKTPPDDSEEADGFDHFVGRSAAMQHVYEQIKQAATTDIPVLMLGETGTGKDMAAQSIHRLSARQNGPYVPVNLGALPSELVASELFGHEKGAFTGAVKQYKGKFEQGRNGTVFLDEIDSMEQKVQVSLLRLIEQNKYYRLGGKRAIRNDARLIAASNADLEKLVNTGSFREDLFYRLDVFRIVLPPLRKRKDDIPLLIDEFLGRFNLLFDKNIGDISSECRRLLEDYDWQGNVRELKNVIQRAVLVCEGDILLPEHFPPRFRSSPSDRPTVTFEIGTSLDEVEKEMIVGALRAAENNRKKAAELLGISRRAIYNKLRKYNLQ